jgi:hypothetical protein
MVLPCQLSDEGKTWLFAKSFKPFSNVAARRLAIPELISLLDSSYWTSVCAKPTHI